MKMKAMILVFFAIVGPANTKAAELTNELGVVTQIKVDRNSKECSGMYIKNGSDTERRFFFPCDQDIGVNKLSLALAAYETKTTVMIELTADDHVADSWRYLMLRSIVLLDIGIVL